MTTQRAVLLGLTGLALALRLLHVHAAADIVLAESPDVGMDRWLAMRMGTAVADGDWLGGWTADYDSAPTYGYWLGALYWPSRGHWLPAVALQALLGAAVVPMVAAIGRRLFSPATGLVAAAFATFYQPSIFYETLLVKFSLVPITVAALLLATDRARETRSVGRTLLAGIALGLLIALRSNAALVLPVVVWWIAGPSPSRADAGRALALVVLGAAVVLAPILARDRIAASGGRGTSLWGIHFYIASHPGADATYAPAEGVSEDPIGHVTDAKRIAEKAEGRALEPGEISRYWFRRGLAFARAEPWYFLRLQARKLRLALAGFEEGSFGDDFESVAEASWVLRLPLVRFGTLGPLALLGLVVAIAWRRGALLPAFVGAYTVSLLPFFVTGRYRLPIAVPMQILAALGLIWLDHARRCGAYRALLAAGAAMAILSFGLPGESPDRWGLLATVAVGLGVLAFLSPEGLSVRDVPERAEPLEPISTDPRSAAARHSERLETGSPVP